MGKLLCIEDDYLTIQTYRSNLLKLNPELIFKSLQSFDHLEKTISEFLPHVVLLDLNLNCKPLNLYHDQIEYGLAVIEKIKLIDTSIKVIVITGYQSEHYGIRALKLGASNFLNKPVNLEHLNILIRDAIHQSQLLRKYRKLKINQTKDFNQNLPGKSDYNHKLIKQIKFAAYNEFPVLLTGHTGTGKKYCAKLIHQLSTRADSPYMSFACSQQPLELILSELFGSKKDDYLGSQVDRQGLMEQAQGGTLFIKEVTGLNTEIQNALISAIESGEYRPLASFENKLTDFRLITSSNKSIRQIMNHKELLKDFFCQLNCLHIHLKPLCERKEDLDLLAINILKRKSSTLKLNAETLATLHEYDWPGNIRELKLCIENASETAIKANRNMIIKQDLELQAVQEKEKPIPKIFDLSEYRNLKSATILFRYDLIKETLIKHDYDLEQTKKELQLEEKLMDQILRAGEELLKGEGLLRL